MRIRTQIQICKLHYEKFAVDLGLKKTMKMFKSRNHEADLKFSYCILKIITIITNGNSLALFLLLFLYFPSWIQEGKWIQIHADPDPQPFGTELQYKIKKIVGLPRAGTAVLLIFCGGPSSREEWRLRTPPVREEEGDSSSLDSSDSFSLHTDGPNKLARCKGCGSAFNFCGSGSSCFTQCGSTFFSQCVSGYFIMRIRIQLNKFVKITL